MTDKSRSGSFSQYDGVEPSEAAHSSTADGYSTASRVPQQAARSGYGGGYSKVAQQRNAAKQREMLAKLEEAKKSEKDKMKGYAAERAERERRLAQERIR